MLSELAVTDDLMQVNNRRYLMSRLEEELQRIRRYHYPLSVIIIDIDHFKHINDEYGHPMGDFVLKELANLLKNNTRSVDIICRYGGDEVVIVLPHAAYQQAYTVAERLRTIIKTH